MRYALFVLPALAFAHAHAGGDATAGEARAAVCMTCSGPQGNSNNPDCSKLAGQHAKYLANQMQAFKNGARKDPLMSAQSANLNDADMEDLAAYFAAQTPQ